jgi:hypothetical protein
MSAQQELLTAPRLRRKRDTDSEAYRPPRVLTRIGLTLLALACVVSIVVSNLPQSEPRNRILETVRPFVNITGLEQNWEVFAPPRPIAYAGLDAEVRFDDGSIAYREIPLGGPLLGAYSDYRWRKFLEYQANDEYVDRIARDYAGWVARELATPTRRPVRVTLIRRWRTITPPGAGGPPYGEPSEARYFETDITPEMLAK